MKTLHVIQGISIIVAGILMWISTGLTMKVIISIILLVNALIEIFS